MVRLLHHTYIDTMHTSYYDSTNILAGTPCIILCILATLVVITVVQLLGVCISILYAKYSRTKIHKKTLIEY